MARITIIGGTGMLGHPVARAFKSAGHDVTITSTRPDELPDEITAGFNVVSGDVTKPDSLKPALSDTDWVYLNLNSKHDPELYEKIEIQGTANVANLAVIAGVKRIGLISGASSQGEENGTIFLDAKVKAERALVESDIPYVIMRPSWFFESLKYFIVEGNAVVLGDQPIPRAWLAADDYAKQVVAAFEGDNTASRCYYNLGPEKLTIKEALTRYCEVTHPDLKPQDVTFSQAKMLAMMPGRKSLKKTIKFFEYIEVTPEDVDPSEANELLGANTTTLEQWLKTR